jgi:hypothetical protein
MLKYKTMSIDFEDIDNLELIVDIPKTQAEFNDRFSLLNSKCSIDDVDFSVSNDDLDILIPIPKTKKEFQDRFVI